MKRSYRFILSIISLASVLSIGTIITFIVMLAMSDYWYYAVIIVCFCYIVQVAIALKVFFSKRLPEVKASWLLTMFLPIFSIVIFFVFGIIPFKLKSEETLKQEKKEILAKEDFNFTKKYIKTHPNSDLITIYNYQASPIYENNRFTFLTQDKFFIECIRLIDKAEHSINVEYYIFGNSYYMRVFLNKLVEKARQGVKIKLMYDFAGTRKREARFKIARLRKEGIEVSVFNPKGINKWISMTNFRSHRKGIYVDNKYALTGGSNIADEYINTRKDFYNWNDLNFLIEGEIVNTQNLYFLYNWYFNSWYRGAPLEQYLNDINDLKIHKAKGSKQIMQAVQTEPYAEYKLFKNVLLSAFANAKKRIYIVTPYLAINGEIEEILNYKARQGVDVQFVMPGRPDNKNFILDANHSSYNRFNDEIKIYEYDGFIHTKAIVVDDDLILGTNNLDYRSMIINFETAFYIQDQKAISEFEAIYQNIVDHSNYLRHNEFYKSRPLYKRIYMNLIKVIYPLI